MKTRRARFGRLGQFLVAAAIVMAAMLLPAVPPGGVAPAAEAASPASVFGGPGANPYVAFSEITKIEGIKLEADAVALPGLIGDGVDAAVSEPVRGGAGGAGGAGGGNGGVDVLYVHYLHRHADGVAAAMAGWRRRKGNIVQIQAADVAAGTHAIAAAGGGNGGPAPDVAAAVTGHTVDAPGGG